MSGLDKFSQTTQPAWQPAKNINWFYSDVNTSISTHNYKWTSGFIESWLYFHIIITNLFVYFIEDPAKKILWAAENNHIDIVRELLSSESDLVGSRDSDGYSPLHRASYNGHHEMVNVSDITLYKSHGPWLKILSLLFSVHSS